MPVIQRRGRYELAGVTREEKKEARENIMAYRLPNGRWVNVIAEGRLVNIAASNGHPAEIMDMSFAVQAMSAMYIKEHYKDLEKKVIDVSAEIDDKIARRKLESWGIEIDALTPEQETYLNSWADLKDEKETLSAQEKSLFGGKLTGLCPEGLPFHFPYIDFDNRGCGR